MKGGLVFKPEGLAQINQDYTQYIRSIDTSALQTFAQQTLSAIKLYTTFCNITADIHSRNSQNETIPLPFKRYIKTSVKQKPHQARSVCNSLSAQLPEIRNKEDFSKLREFAYQNQVELISAGLSFNSHHKILQYNSDYADATRPDLFKIIFYGGQYTGKKHHGNWNDPHVLQALTLFPAVYMNSEQGFYLKVADINDLNQEVHIICEKIITPKSSKDPQHAFFTQSALHSCQRDLSTLQSATTFAIAELQALTTLNFTFLENSQDLINFLPKISRKKRFAPLLFPFAFKAHYDRIAYTKENSFLKNNYAPINEDLFQKFQSMVALETFEITPPFKLNTIPALIVALKAFHQVLNSTLPFSKWIATQAARQELYTTFRTNKTLTSLSKRFTKNINNFEDFIASSKNITDDQYETLTNSLEKLLIEPPLLAHNKTTIDQLPFQFSFPLPSYKYTQKRSKRAIPFIIGAAIAGSAASIATYEISQYINKASLVAPDEETLNVYKQFGTQLNNIQINQNQIKRAINEMNTRMSQFERDLISNFQGALIVTLEIELKALIRHQQQVIQTTVLKYNQVLEAASQGKTSPFILSQGELSSLTSKFLSQNSIQLSDKLETTKTIMSIQNNTISFIIRVPIIDHQKQFSLYTITPIPTFANFSAHIPSPDSTHIAINMNGDKYTTLSDMELTKCLSLPPICTSTKPIAPISDHTSCVATTYTSNTYSCPFEPYDQSKGTTYVRFYKLNMIFSTQHPQNIFIKCYNPSDPHNIQETTINLTNMGLKKVKHSCDITLPDGTTHKTTKLPQSIHFSSNLFDNVHSLEHIDPLTIHTIKRSIPHTALVETPITQFDYSLHSSIQHHAISTGTAIFISLASFLLILICIFKCCPKLLSNPIHTITHFRQQPFFATSLHARDHQAYNHNWFPDQDPEENPSILPNQHTQWKHAPILTSTAPPTSILPNRTIPSNIHTDI